MNIEYRITLYFIGSFKSITEQTISLTLQETRNVASMYVNSAKIGKFRISKHRRIKLRFCMQLKFETFDELFLIFVAIVTLRCKMSSSYVSDVRLTLNKFKTTERIEFLSFPVANVLRKIAKQKYVDGSFEPLSIETSRLSCKYYMLLPLADLVEFCRLQLFLVKK